MTTSIITNFIFGLIIMAIGLLIVKNNYKITNSYLSKNNIFEQKFGGGSTYTMLYLASFLMIFFGFLMMFSIHDNVLRIIFSPITNLIS